MKALILNSGTGSRMGEMTSQHPKCMTMLSDTESILSRQLRQLCEQSIKDIVITTGPFEEILKTHCEETLSNLATKHRGTALNITFVHNPEYKSTNYIYSIYRAKDCLHGDLILMHGDLVFDDAVLSKTLNSSESCMTVSSTTPLPEKDFKAVVTQGRDTQILKVGVEFFDNSLTAQPLYKLCKGDWELWLQEIISFCEAGNLKCYAEKALNKLLEAGQIVLRPLDVAEALCSEIDTPEDWLRVKEMLERIPRRS